MSPEAELERTRAALIEEGAVLCFRLGGDAPLRGACEAALKGGLQVLELTLTTPGALDEMERLAGDGTALVGAGTVLSPDDVVRTRDAGGRFVMSPVFDPEVVDTAHELGLLAVPGAATPKEILAAHRHGARLVKVFPSGALGGPAYLRAVRGPLSDVAFVPTSGPTAETLGAYLSAGAVAVGVGGAEVFPPDFTLRGIEAAVARIRAALDASRMGAAAGADAAEAHVSVTPVLVGRSIAHGVVCRWRDGQYVAIVAPGGMVACGIFDPAVCERFGFAVAMAHGTPEAPLAEPADVLAARIDTVSPAAASLGIEPGMPGRDALVLLLGAEAVA